MATSFKDLRRKIKSIQGTKKLTQAMQMVAASKMQKSIKQAEMSRHYSRLAWEIIKNIGAKTDISRHPLLQKRAEKNIALILITSNRGLCGGLNTKILRKVTNYLKEKEESKIAVDLMTMGNRGRTFITRYFKNFLTADFVMPDRLIDFSDITPLAKVILDDYISGKYDRVYVFYNQFISTLKQEPIRRQLLPIPSLIELEEHQLISFTNKKTAASQIPATLEYHYEPDASAILDIILPKIIQTQLHQVLLESSASEHSARMVAMKNATDNAGTLIDDLTLTYNGLRQTVITKEITEISAGAEAAKR